MLKGLERPSYDRLVDSSTQVSQSFCSIDSVVPRSEVGTAYKQCIAAAKLSTRLVKVTSLRVLSFASTRADVASRAFFFACSSCVGCSKSGLDTWGRALVVHPDWTPSVEETRHGLNGRQTKQQDESLPYSMRRPPSCDAARGRQLRIYFAVWYDTKGGK